MRQLLQPCLIASFLALTACSPASDPAQPGTGPAQTAPDPAKPSRIPTQAQVDQFLAEGPEPTMQKMRPVDYWLHYKVMQASGLEKELGGEEKTIAALQALGNAYERKLRAVDADKPKLVKTGFTGEGMTTGVTGMGLGGFVGLMTGSLVNGAVSNMSDKDLAALVKDGPMKLGTKEGDNALEFSEDGSVSQSLEFEVNENGLNGKVKVKTKMDACPDADGKVTVTVDVDSQMSASGKPGTGGSVKSEFRYERYLDDDAHLMSGDNASAANLHVQMGGSENFQHQSVDITLGWDRAGKAIYDPHGESGYSIFRPGEVEQTLKLLQGVQLLQTLIAEAMLRGMGSSGSPWEGGRCVTLDVTSDPGKRKGIKPNTAFDIQAKPRAKADGMPTRGTVTATLNGGASLQPASGKVPADAKYGYAGPAKEKEVATIDFEARSKRGVGKASLEFDTKKGGYSMVGGNCAQAVTVCDITKPFTRKVCGATVTHTPTSDKGGTYSFLFEGGGGFAKSSGTYTLSGPEERLVALHSSSTVCATGGMTRCYSHPAVTAIWTRIDECTE